MIVMTAPISAIISHRFDTYLKRMANNYTGAASVKKRAVLT